MKMIIIFSCDYSLDLYEKSRKNLTSIIYFIFVKKEKTTSVGGELAIVIIENLLNQLYNHLLMATQRKTQ